MSMSNKKYYWLKLKRDFFKRHDIQIIEAMPNGKDYVLFYLKLLVESIDHNGSLRFSDTIPYNEQMLATITSTNVDIVRSAMKVFTELKMMDVLDDKTIYMNEIQGLVGSETHWAEEKRKYRLGQCPNNVRLMSSMSDQCPTQEKDTDKEKESETDKKPFLSDADADDLADGLNAVFDKARYVGFKCTQQELDALNLMVADYGKDAVLLALEKAGEASAPKIGYLKGIFKNDVTGGAKPKETKDERTPAKRLQDARSRLIAQGKYKEADKLTLHDLECV